MELPDYDPTATVRPTDVRKGSDLRAQTLDFDRIPIIDIGPALTGTDKDRLEVAAQLRSAAETVGFFYLKNHGVPEGVIEDALAAAQEFYALPEETKRRYDVAKSKRHRGYVPVGGLSADPTISDLQEGYEVGLELGANDPDYLAGNPLAGPNVWPAEVPAFQKDVYTYFDALLQLGRRLFGLFAIALDMPGDHFEPMITKPCAQLRVMYYPAGDPADPSIGIGAHTDYESFTLLWQSEEGLQVQNRSGDWIVAPPIPGTFIVNIADMLMRWTNDRFVSTPHRVINASGRERYSMALFFAANYDTVVECLPTCTDAENPPKYPPTHFGYWIENMHSYSYAYRWEDRGKLPNPELVPSDV